MSTATIAAPAAPRTGRASLRDRLAQRIEHEGIALGSLAREIAADVAEYTTPVIARAVADAADGKPLAPFLRDILTGRAGSAAVSDADYIADDLAHGNLRGDLRRWNASDTRDAERNERAFGRAA